MATFRREVVEVLAAAEEAADDIADRAGDKEIFLQQAQFAAGLHRIGRIEDFRDSLGDIFCSTAFI